MKIPLTRSTLGLLLLLLLLDLGGLGLVMSLRLRRAIDGSVGPHHHSIVLRDHIRTSAAGLFRSAVPFLFLVLRSSFGPRRISIEKKLILTCDLTFPARAREP